MENVELRDVRPDDIAVFFEHQRDPEAAHMAAFVSDDPNDRAGYEALWTGILADDRIVKRTIVVGETIVGNIAHFMQFGFPAIGYWIGREHWGRGYATAAIRAFLAIVHERPLYARTAFDNVGSQRVLEKCGFAFLENDRGYASARKKEIVERVYVLR
jgi:RimJ/RimL family protein N-acetyltransferase